MQKSGTGSERLLKGLNGCSFFIERVVRLFLTPNIQFVPDSEEVRTLRWS